ncbi:MAG: hypothetical protein K9G67_15320 [Bacteroidales bacterium]|nr:hypothetical protein [Bacteroidales bacterium]MCF8343659.1 hypothetical protein [Bacteroidales bacterium]MCF8351364.1 hypothetical protein [Bacteroidales bacterium]MCF8377725.1 hypothetical protein [Bacteroidales bacterium]
MKFHYRHRHPISDSRFVLMLLLLLFVVPIYAQFYNGSQLEFGKNRVQYRDFIWTYYMFDDYDVYFYRDGQKLAEFVARKAEDQITRLERRLETTVNDKVQFIVFNNLSDLKQSNIGLESDEEYNTGGVTKIVGKKVILYFNGSYEDFEKQLQAGVSNVVINQLLYGGNIGSQIKNSTLFVLPDWYLNGLISYLSDNWSTEIDNRVRDGIRSGLYEKFNHLRGDEAIYAGHSLWNYINQEYGKSAIPNILHMTNISHSIENGFLYVIGKSFKTLMKEWIDYYEQYYADASRFEPLPEKPLLKKTDADARYQQLTTSPDGVHAAYVTNELGQYKVWLYNLQKDKKKKIYKNGFRLGENVDYSYPILNWHPSGRLLAFLIEKEGFPYLMLYNLETRTTDEILMVQFEKINNFNYSDDGRTIVLSAVKQGQSDIFVFEIASGSFQQITFDPFTDKDPCFFDNSSKILFSSNRTSDTLEMMQDEFLKTVPATLDIYMYDYKSRSNILKRLTETPLANEKQPLPYDRGYIAFLSDRNGIYNQYIGKFDSAISYVDTTVHYRYFMNDFPVTNYPRSIISHRPDPISFKNSLIIMNEDEYRMYIKELIPQGNIDPVTPTTTSYMQQMNRLEGEKEKIKQGVKSRPEKREKRRRRFRNVYENEQKPKQKNRENEIDIENYEFEKQSIIKIEGNKEVETNFDPDAAVDEEEEDKFKLPNRRYYRVEYFFNELTTQLDFNFLNASYQQFTGGGPIYLNPGFNALLKVGVSDLMEDHRIVGGVRLNVNLINNEYLLSYQNLKHRLDKQIVFHRQSLEGVGNYSIIRYYTNELFYILSWPFNEAMSLRGTLSLRSDQAVHLSTDRPNLQEPNRYETWGGIKGEFVFDDTRNIGLNLYYGTRYKIFGEYLQLVAEDTRNLVVLGADFRHYTKIHRSFIWANRLAMSTSFGQNKLIYYMGGVDNWLFPKFNNQTPIDFSQNYWYQTLATNMRGFKQNIRNGNNFFVLNSELRFPVFKYFFNRPIKSDFLNTFQIVAFGDVGTAWTGWNPYSKENSLYTRTVDDGPLHITVEVQKEPIVTGFGFGARARILGYFLRADWAWGMEDWVVKPSVFYLSLSLDF